MLQGFASVISNRCDSVHQVLGQNALEGRECCCAFGAEAELAIDRLNLYLAGHWRW